MNEKLNNTVNINLDTKDLDNAIEKVNQLKNLLLEVKGIMDSFNEIDFNLASKSANL